MARVLSFIHMYHVQYHIYIFSYWETAVFVLFFPCIVFSLMYILHKHGDLSDRNAFNTQIILHSSSNLSWFWVAGKSFGKYLTASLLEHDRITEQRENLKINLILCIS